MNLFIEPALDLTPDHDRIYAKNVTFFDPNRRGLFSIDGDWLPTNNVRGVTTVAGVERTMLVISQIKAKYYLVVTEWDSKGPNKQSILLIFKDETGVRHQGNVAIQGKTIFYEVDGGDLVAIFSSNSGDVCLTDWKKLAIQAKTPLSRQDWKNTWDALRNAGRPLGIHMPIEHLSSPGYRAGMFMSMAELIPLIKPLVPDREAVPDVGPDEINRTFSRVPVAPSPPLPPPVNPHITLEKRSNLPDLPGLSNLWLTASGVLITLDDKKQPTTLVGLIGRVDAFRGEEWARILEEQAQNMQESAAMLNIMAQAARMSPLPGENWHKKTDPKKKKK